MDDILTDGSSHATTKLTLFATAKMNYDAGKSMQCWYEHCSMPKHTSQAEVTSNIKSVALLSYELHLSEAIRQQSFS